jgi:DNA polymerase elongation subunit (family B)
MFSSLALQDLDWGRRIPTKPQFDKVPYTGADVMTVDAGVYDNVGILDIKAMYHSNASLHNISWETLDPEGKNCGNGTTFNMANKGMLVRQMDKMTELRNVFKVKLMLSDSDSEKDKWDTMQFACKSLVASMYGVAGDAKYGLYHPEVAAAITYTSRSTLDRLKTLCNDAGYKVYYGHTDSVFVGIPSPEAGQDLVVGLNAQMKPIEVEFEKWCDRMLLMAKNRYAGNVTWTDGAGHPPKLYIKGIEMKQSRMPQIMKDSMNGIIGGILANIEEKTITDNIKELVLKVSSGEIDKGMVCMKGKLERNLSDYKQLSGASAGAAWANEYLGKGYRAGSFFLVTLNAKGKYMAFDDPEELDGLYEIGYKELADRFIIKKIQPYYEMMGWDLQPLHNVIDGKGRLQWI